MDPDEVARHQKARLEGAMVEAVARHGFAATTVRELVTLAGVSKSTFYDHFQSKEECFLVTFDTIVAEVTAEVIEANQSSDDFRQRLVAGFGRFMELVIERPEAAAFATVDSLTLGSAGIAHRERSWEAFEQMARQYFVDAAPQQQVSDLTVRAIIAGVSGVVYRRLRSSRTEELPGLIEPLIDWALSYQEPESKAVKAAVAAAERPAARPAAEDDGAPDWEEPPDSPISRSVLSQRERIIRAAARVVVERGYESLSIPAISAAAGTSNQTFYENFKSKREAFLTAYETASADALRVGAEAFEAAAELPEAVGASLRALTEYIAENRTYGRLAFVELPTAGPPALDRADETMNRLISFLEPEKRAKAAKAAPPRVVLEATASGIWFVIQREIANGRREALPETAPELAKLAISPLSLP
jgi:AcrR family transcriptional regulator